MGLDITIFKLPKGIVVNRYDEVWDYEDCADFRNNYEIRDLLVEAGRKFNDRGRDISNYCDTIQLTEQRIKFMKELLKERKKKKDRSYKYYKPQKLLRILKKTDKYDYWANWVS